MWLNHHTERIMELVGEHGEMKEHVIADVLQLPLGNVRALLMSRKCFAQNPDTKRWRLVECEDSEEQQEITH